MFEFKQWYVMSRRVHRLSFVEFSLVQCANSFVVNVS